MKRKTKNTIKNVVLVILAVLLGCGAIGACVSIFGNDAREISPFEFRIGGLDEEGEYIEQKNSLYTDLIECQGLKITPKEECKVTYRIFFFDAYKTFFKSTAVLDSEYNKKETAAKYCKIVIFPDGNNEDDFEIGAFDVWGYVDDLKITVNKKQDFKLVDWFAKCLDDENGHGQGYIGDTDNTVLESATFSYVGPIDCDEYASVVFVYGNQEESWTGSVIFCDVDGIPMQKSVYKAESNVRQIVEVPEGAYTMYVNYNNDCDFVINYYEKR